MNFQDAEIYSELISRKVIRKSDYKIDTVALVTNINPELKEFSTDTLISYIKSLYGKDDRFNLFDDSITNEIKADAKKVACIIERNQLNFNSDGTFTLKLGRSYGSKNLLCNTENFWTEPTLSFCSGFAISEKLFATAGHCINPNNLEKVLIIYGYYMIDSTTPNIKINPKDIYEPVKIIRREFGNTSNLNDYCVVEVNKTFDNFRIASIRLTGKIADNSIVHVIGHPSGLPIKVALNAKIFNNSITNYFTINSDTYSGNSGSPVFNSIDHTVEGILVRGSMDFKLIDNNNCFISLSCPENIGNCRGEDVSRTSQFNKLISPVSL